MMNSSLLGCVPRVTVWLASLALFLAACSSSPSSSTREPTDTSSDVSYAALVGASQPIGYWPLDEQNGSAMASAMPGAEASYLGGVQLGEPPAIDAGTSVFLDGSSAAIWLGPSDSEYGRAVAAEDAITVALWVRVAEAPESGEVMHLARWRWYGWGIYVVDGVLRAEVWEVSKGDDDASLEPAGSTLEGPSLTTETWYHVALTRDATTTRLYVDGAVVAERMSTGEIYYLAIDADDDCCGTGGGVAFGRDADVDGNYFHGWLDEIAIYPAALSAQTVAAHHAFGDR